MSSVGSFRMTYVPKTSNTVPKAVQLSPLLCHNRACEPNAICSICHQEFVDPPDPMSGKRVARDFVCMSCGHVYHPACIGEWINTHKTCPICREEGIHVVYTSRCTQNRKLERWVTDNDDNVNIRSAVLYNQPTTDRATSRDLQRPAEFCIIDSLWEFCKGINEYALMTKLRDHRIDHKIHIGHDTGSWVALGQKGGKEGRPRAVDDAGNWLWDITGYGRTYMDGYGHLRAQWANVEDDGKGANQQEIHDYFTIDRGIAMDENSTIILELGIREQPSFLGPGSTWIKKVIADCKSIKTCFHHSLILQEGVEVVPDYDGSVKHYIFLRFLIQVDNHVAGSGAHCCGISLKRRRDGHPKFHKPEISH